MEEQQSIDEAYEQRLSQDIALKRSFLELAKEQACGLKSQNDARLQKLPMETQRKLRILALHEANSKVPLYPERGDALSISLMNMMLLENVSNNLVVSEAFAASLNTAQDAVNSHQQFHDDMAMLMNLLDARINQLKKTKAGLKEEISSGRVGHSQKVIKAQLEHKQETLMSSCQKVISDYLIEYCLHEYYKGDGGMADKWKEQSIHLIESLLNNMIESSDEYIKISNPNDPILRLLLRNGLILEKNGLEYVKLRQLGGSFA